MSTTKLLSYLVLMAMLLGMMAVQPVTVRGQGEPIVYVVLAIDTESDNHQQMGSYPPTLDLGSYVRPPASCSPRQSRYSLDGSWWTAYGDRTVFNYDVTPTGQTTAVESFTCGTDNSYGLDSASYAVRFTVPQNGSYDIRAQISYTGAPAATHFYVTPDASGQPDTNPAHRLATFVASTGSVTSGAYTTIAANLSLQTGIAYWWYGERSGDASNHFAVYRGVGQTTTISLAMDENLRDSLRDSDDQPFQITWYIEMDSYIDQAQMANGTPVDYLALYHALMDNWGVEIARWGDEIAYHHHFMHWNGSSWLWTMSLAGYQKHNEALAAMAFNGGFFPSTFRSGWLWSSNESQAWIENWLPIDYSNSPEAENWLDAPENWIPYHPSAGNYQVPGDMQHQIARCDGFVSESRINDTFVQAQTSGGPAVYCWYLHQNDLIDAAMIQANGYLQAAATAHGIPFVYATGREAVRGLLDSADTTPPNLAIAAAGSGAYTITADEALWGTRPFVAGRYVAGSREIYTFPGVTSSGGLTWQATVPDTVTRPPEPYTLYGVTAERWEVSNPPGWAIDGDPYSYWDSSPGLPVWIRMDVGESQPVAQMMIHFYDDDSRQYTYYVEASTDGNTWTPIVSPNTAQGQVIHQFSPAISMRYARVTVTGNTANPSAHIKEMALYRAGQTYQLWEIAAAASDTHANSSVTIYEAIPTAVVLASFQAKLGAGQVAVTWETASEADNLGFNLYRAETAAGPYARLNAALIPSRAPGSPIGGTYAWHDREVRAGATYYYKLEDVDTHGRGTLHGPVWAAPHRFYLPLVRKG